MSNPLKNQAISRTPRIVLILPTYLPETFGGAEQQSRRFAATLSKRNAGVTLLAPRLMSATLKREQQGGVRIERFTLSSLPNLGGRHFLSFLWWTLRIVWWLWRNRNGYDVVHVIHARLHAVGPVLGSRLARKPCLIKFGRGGSKFDIDVVGSKRLLGPQFASIITRLTTGFIANSSEMVVDTARHGIDPARVHRIPNGVIIPEEKRTNRPASDRPAFLFMGRLDREKALDLMLRSFAALPASIPAKLMIVGEGPKRQELEDLASKLQLDGRVDFMGRMEDVTPAIREADFYLSTSLSEGMSNSMLESMSYGVVPVVTRVSGVEDMVSDGVNGLLFEAGDSSSCQEAIFRAATVPPQHYLKLSDRARDTVASQFSMDMVVEHHLALYRHLMEKADPQSYAR